MRGVRRENKRLEICVHGERELQICVSWGGGGGGRETEKEVVPTIGALMVDPP